MNGIKRGSCSHQLDQGIKAMSRGAEFPRLMDTKRAVGQRVAHGSSTSWVRSYLESRRTSPLNESTSGETTCGSNRRIDICALLLSQDDGILAQTWPSVKQKIIVTAVVVLALLPLPASAKRAHRAQPASGYCGLCWMQTACQTLLEAELDEAPTNKPLRCTCEYLEHSSSKLEKDYSSPQSSSAAPLFPWLAFPSKPIAR
jgi:hypothetical protein